MESGPHTLYIGDPGADSNLPKKAQPPQHMKPEDVLCPYCGRRHQTSELQIQRRLEVDAGVEVQTAICRATRQPIAERRSGGVWVLMARRPVEVEAEDLDEEGG